MEHRTIKPTTTGAKMRRFLIVFLLPLFFSCVTGKKIPDGHTLNSPNKQISVFVRLNKQGKLYYTTTHGDTVALRASRLGLIFNDRDFSEGMRFISISPVREHHESYTLLQGKKRNIIYRANEQTLTLENSQNQQIQIVFRLSNDGVAFKYRLLGDGKDDVIFSDELTSFAFPKDSRAWLQPVAVAQTGWKNTNPSYEEHYLTDIATGTPSPSPAGWVFPALFKVKDTWLAITEAGMDGSFHASRLQAQAPEREYLIGKPMDAEVFSHGDLLAKGALPFETPWRILTLGSLSTLIESTLGTDLASPPKTAYDFVKPGFVAWSWALLKDEATNFETQKQFIDFAAQMHWPYTLIDASWDIRIGREKIHELVEYAERKNIGILLWYNSSGDWNQTELTPKSQLIDPTRRRQEFAWLRDIGVKGIKIDFFAGDGKSMMSYYNALAKDAAEFELLVNYHGSSLPRGLHRTYPNLLTMEAVHGFEMITFNQNSADVAAKHMAMLPFTRNLFDPMDFTPTAFSVIPGIEKRTSKGFELALPVLFLSGLQHIAETPYGLAKEPSYVKEMLSAIPVNWDESKFLAGYPGDHVVIARRKSNTWYIAGINARDDAITLSLNLDFIKDQKGMLITDGATQSLKMVDIEAKSTTSIRLNPNGGFLMKFEKPRLANGL